MYFLNIKLLFLSVFVFFGTAYNQSQGLLKSETCLISKGEIPAFLKQNKNSFFYPQHINYFKIPKKKLKESYLNHVYSSNFVVFGDEVSDFCEKVLAHFGFKNKVYLVRELVHGTFSNTQGDIFITTGLISHLTSEAELAFFLLREKLIIDNKIPSNLKTFKSDFTLGQIVKMLSTRSFENECLADSLAFSKLIESNSYSKKQIHSAFDIMLYSEAPFMEVKVNWSTFIDEKLYIPSPEFKNIRRVVPQYYQPNLIFPEIQKRKEKIEKLFQIEKTITNDLSFLIDSKAFNSCVYKCRKEAIIGNFLEGDFHIALYEVLCLEQNGIEDKELILIKIKLWYALTKHILRNKFYVNKSNLYKNTDNEGALFCRFFKLQSDASIVTIGLRVVNDLKTKLEPNQYVERLHDEMVQVMARLKGVKLTDYSKFGITEIKKINDSIQKLDINTMNRMDQFKNSTLIDSFRFYLYAIPDLVQNKSFIDKYNKYYSDSLFTNSKSKNVFISNFQIEAFKDKHYKSEFDKAKLLVQAKDGLSLKREVKLTVKDLDTIYLPDDYNKKYYLNASILQFYNHNTISLDPLDQETPYFAKEITQNQTENSCETFGLSIYKHQYKPNLRAIHSLGLFVIPLPYVIPHYFLTGHKSIFQSFYFNRNTGALEGFTSQKFNDPINKEILRNLIIHSIQSNFN